MNHSFRTGEANAAAVVMATGFLVLCVAAAYYVIVGAPIMNNNNDDASSSSSSSFSSVVSSTMTTSSSDARTPAEQAAYDGCINAATEAHNQRWASACEEKKQAQESAYLACVKNKDDQSYCTAQYGGYENIGANCDLGTVRTAALNTQYALAKQQCAN